MQQVRRDHAPNMRRSRNNNKMKNPVFIHLH